MKGSIGNFMKRYWIENFVNPNSKGEAIAFSFLRLKTIVLISKQAEQVCLSIQCLTEHKREGNSV